jgi:hypothetical protein
MDALGSSLYREINSLAPTTPPSSATAAQPSQLQSISFAF